MMKDFIRKNLTLVVFLGFTAVAAAILLVMDLERYHRINESIEKIEEAGETITRINNTGVKAPGAFEENPEWTDEEAEKAFREWNKKRQNTPIVKGNADKIKQDAEALARKTREIQRIYGHAYDKAFNAFLDVLKKAENPDVRANFEKMDIASVQELLRTCVTGKNFSGFSPDDQDNLFKELRAEICKAPRSVKEDDAKAAYEKTAGAAFDKAFAEFTKEVSVLTAEDLANTSLGVAAQSFFMQVLGIPRYFYHDAHYRDYVDRLSAALVEKKALPDRNVKFAEWQVKNILTGRNRNSQEPPSLANPEVIPHYMIRIQVYEDLFARMKKAGIAELVMLLPQGEAMGEKIEMGGKNDYKDYKVYSYKMTVAGTMPEIRKFLNELHQAYKDNRVYSMKNLVLQRRDTVALDDKKLDSPSVSAEVVSSLGVIRKYIAIEEGRKKQAAKDEKQPAPASGTKKKAAEAKVIKKAEEDPDYGAVSLGGFNEVTATFDLDYIVYTGDMIEKTKSR